MWEKIKDGASLVFAITWIIFAIVILRKERGGLNVKESINNAVTDVLNRTASERRKRIKNPLQ